MKPGRSRAAPRAGTKRAPAHRLVRWLVVRGLGVVFLVAFVSYWVQLEGLVGSNGILPAGAYLDRAREALGAGAYVKLPTLCWLSASDGFLHLLCGAGVLLSVVLIAGIAPLPVTVALWALYLSLVVVGQTFYSFQWDMLLLESALTALFLAPARRLPLNPADAPEPARAGVFLLRLLVFKLMFLSGATKLLSLDDTWWNLTALEYHYFTQPLPVWTAWYAHRLPSWFQRASTFVMFVVELGLPFLVFGPRAARLVAFSGLAALQILIGATGNYTFFNLLAFVLCLAILDDGQLARVIPASLRARLRPAAASGGRSGGSGWRARRLAVTAAAAVLAVVSGVELTAELVRTPPRASLDGNAGGRLVAVANRAVLSWGRPLMEVTGPFRSINGYGLFRSMTTTRPEIVLEASDDGRAWREIAFRWKPGDPARRPRFVQPHQPRLDWQMWFAALDLRRAEPWLAGLVHGLLEGRPEIAGLLAPGQFPDGPPGAVRLAFYEYEFTTPEQARESGDWWTRRRLGETRPVPRGAIEPR